MGLRAISFPSSAKSTPAARLVSIARRHFAPLSSGGRFTHCDLKSALKIKKRRSPVSSPRSVLASSCTQTVRASGLFQCGPPPLPFVPNHSRSGILSSSRSSPSSNLRRCRTGYRRTSAIVLRKKSTRSSFFAARSQSNQLIGLSWQYALLLTCCVRANSSPPSSMGVPDAKSNAHAWFFMSWRRSASTPASVVSPSAPQFQELLSLDPSLLFSPFASLCLPLYETRSFSVKPSWHVTKLTLLYAERPSSPYRSAEPVSRQPRSASCALSPLSKRRTVSRKRPFHSDQSTGKLPT